MPDPTPDPPPSPPVADVEPSRSPTATTRRLAVGQRVRWKTKGRDGPYPKLGQIVAVVEPGQTPYGAFPAAADEASYLVQFNLGSVRYEQVSYLVRVSAGTGGGKPKLYWPRTKGLESEGFDEVLPDG
jgi:hypothetical protein